jgi:transcriptional regulator with XRE-family HTH domain
MINLRQLRSSAGIEREELGRRAAMSADEVAQSEGSAAREPRATKALRFAHSLRVSIDRLTDRIYWNPGEVAPRARERRPPSERLAGFFLVLPAIVPVFDPALPREPVASRREAAEILGRNLRGARERRHLTQETLAGAAGLSKAGLSLVERGVRETTIETLLSLACSLEVTPEFLLGGITWIPKELPCAPPRRGGARHHTAHSLDDAIRDLWNEDKTAGEIADAVGASPGSVSAIVHRLREHGEELSYRNPPTRAVHEGARRRRPCRGVPPPDKDRASEAVADAAGQNYASDDDVAAQIGANVAFHRSEAGLTQEQLGEAIEADRTYVSHIERGVHVPRLSLVVKLAASLNVRCGRVTSGVSWEPSSGAFRVEATDGKTDPAPKRLGQNALRARRRIGISQAALSAHASISRGDVVDFERGNRNFRIFTAVRLAGALGVDFAELFSGLADWYVRPLPAPEYALGDRRPTKAERDAVLVRLWREGRPEREIAEALDLTISAVGPYVAELRDAGEDLPHRRPPRRAAEIAARRRRRDRCVRQRTDRSRAPGGSPGESSGKSNSSSDVADYRRQKPVHAANAQTARRPDPHGT